jgi:hypothetical protein
VGAPTTRGRRPRVGLGIPMLRQHDAAPARQSTNPSRLLGARRLCWRHRHHCRLFSQTIANRGRRGARPAVLFRPRRGESSAGLALADRPKSQYREFTLV